RERFWDIPVPKIDSPTRQPLLPRPSCAHHALTAFASLSMAVSEGGWGARGELFWPSPQGYGHTMIQGGAVGAA
ncbi:MAG: hypothetical protein AB2815_10910, partial [Candidatus Sedimenticola endophacoides]